MKNINSKLLPLLVLMVMVSLIACGGSDDETPMIPETCVDGILNQDETDIDCGGVCTACPTCFDGIQNQDETDVDCGGVCSPCFVFSEEMTAIINGDPFTANLVAGFESDGLIDFQSDQSQERQLFFSVPSEVELGNYDLVNTTGFSAEYKKLFDGEYLTQSGMMTITRHDTLNNELSGIFEFTGIEFSFGSPIDTVVVETGIFAVEYFN